MSGCTPLESALAAVPDEIKTVRDWTSGRIIAEAERCADLIASGADVLWAAPDAPKADVTPSQISAAMATGLAILAHRDGGVTFAGRHWCVEPHDRCPGPGECVLPAPAHDRSATGAWYTPRALAEEVATHAIDALAYAPGPLHTLDRADWEPAHLLWLLDLRIVDIACGTGAFLVAACRIMADHLLAHGYWTGPGAVQDARRAAMRTLHGADVNPWSVELAGLALALLAPDRPAPQVPRLVCGDSLVGTADPKRPVAAHILPDVPHLDWPQTFPHIWPDHQCKQGFDIVIGNPPFLGGRKIGGALGAPYREHLVKTIAGGKRGSADLAAYFLLRAHQLLSRRHGVCGIVATNTLTQGDTREVGLDQVVADGWVIYRAVKSRPWPSSSAAVHVCLGWTVAGPGEDGVDPALAEMADAA